MNGSNKVYLCTYVSTAMAKIIVQREKIKIIVKHSTLNRAVILHYMQLINAELFLKISASTISVTTEITLKMISMKISFNNIWIKDTLI